MDKHCCPSLITMSDHADDCPSYTCFRGLPTADRIPSMTALELIDDTAEALETLSAAMLRVGQQLRSNQLGAMAAQLRAALNTMEAKP